MRTVLLYTMTSGLGDLIVMGDVMQKAERLLPDCRALMVHRGNPHVSLWQKDDHRERFFDIYTIRGWWKMISDLRASRRKGAFVYAIQMAPGSIQGFFLHLFLKRMGCVDCVVDLNLFNADIVYPRRGGYLLELHLNQLADIFHVSIPPEFLQLTLPFQQGRVINKERGGRFRIGIHPWGRRSFSSSFFWPVEKWKAVIAFLFQKTDVEVVLLGKDVKFDALRRDLMSMAPDPGRLSCEEACSVEKFVESINDVDLLITVNTASAHIGCALKKPMFILNGPSRDFWIPKAGDIVNFYDSQATFPGMDKISNDPRFPSVSRIPVDDVIDALRMYLIEGSIISD